jgi:signal peptidase I
MPEMPRETLFEASVMDVVAAPAPEKTPGPAPPDKPPAKSAVREGLESLVVTLITALFVITFLVQAFQIPSSSMEDTLLIGDHVMVDKLSFAPPTAWLGPLPDLLPYRPIHRGDVVVFKYPVDPTMHLVKRAIGLPGDRVRIRHRQVFVNGQALVEPFSGHKSGFHEEYRDEFPEPPVGPVFQEWSREMPRHVKDGWLVVPQGYYFVMGDNRDYSSDSRYWGFVPRENIVGRPVIVYWSLNSTSHDYQRTGIPSPKSVWETLVNLPRKIRWERIFRTIHGVP